MVRIVVSAVVAMVVVAAAWSGYWQVKGGWLNSELDRRADALDLKFSCASRQTSGYPFDFHITCDDLRLAGVRGQRFELIAPGATLSLRALDLRWMSVVLSGPVKVEFQDAAGDGAMPGRTSVQLHTNQLRMVARLAKNKPPEIAVVTENFRAGLTRWLARKPVRSVRINGRRVRGSMKADAATPGDAAWIDFSATALNVRIDPPPARGLGTTEVALARLRARAGKATQLRGTSLAARFKRWQRAGGALSELTFDITTDQLGLSGKGAVALGDGGRVEGRIKTRISGMNRLLQRLIDAKVIKKNSAILVRAAADLLSGDAGPDGGNQVRLPLTFKRGKVFFGPIPIGRLAPLF